MGGFALIMIAALVALSCALSTKEQRTAARAKFRPYGRGLWIATAVAWALFLFPWWPRG
jgi:hypothetical protein